MTHNLKTNKRDEDPVANCMKQVEPFDLSSTVSDHETHLSSEAHYLWPGALISLFMKGLPQHRSGCFTFASLVRRRRAVLLKRHFLIRLSLPLFSWLASAPIQACANIEARSPISCVRNAQATSMLRLLLKLQPRSSSSNPDRSAMSSSSLLCCKPRTMSQSTLSQICPTPSVIQAFFSHI